MDQGSGPLLAWHDPDEQRRWILENKSREMRDKRTSLEEAVARFVPWGSYLTMGGFGHVRTPMAAVYEIIRQGKRRLLMAGKPGVHDMDLLIAAGSVDRVEVAYGFGHELRGLSPASRRSAERGEVQILTEWSNAAFEWRLKAAAMGLPFIPVRVMMGTDTLIHSSAKVVRDPFSEKLICLVPACYPDVAIIHVHQCDRFGNCRVSGGLSMDIDLARAARRLIITTEQIIPTEEIQREPERTLIPFYLTDAIAEVQYGSHPGNMPYLYYFDEEHIAKWLDLSKTSEGIQQYLDTYVYKPRGFSEYLESVGGEVKMMQLRLLENREAENTHTQSMAGSSLR